MPPRTYNAPWGTTLRIVSCLCVALGFIIPGMVYSLDQKGPANWLPVGCLYWGIMFFAALFTVRGYSIETNELLVQRLLWVTRLPLSELRSAAFTPNAMRGSIRLWGNGGMLAITGWYRNPALGNYRAFVTELKNTVVLRFAKRTVVISPENPEQFVTEISSRQS